jgi:protein-tyrosine phosphatase
LLDLVVPSPARLQRAAHLVQAQRSASQGGPVWVCCALGFSRSAAAVVAWQLLHQRAPDLAQAEARTRQARPQLVLGPGWLDALRRLSSSAGGGGL